MDDVEEDTVSSAAWGWEGEGVRDTGAGTRHTRARRANE